MNHNHYIMKIILVYFLLLLIFIVIINSIVQFSTFLFPGWDVLNIIYNFCTKGLGQQKKYTELYSFKFILEHVSYFMPPNSLQGSIRIYRRHDLHLAKNLFNNPVIRCLIITNNTRRLEKGREWRGLPISLEGMECRHVLRGTL